MGGIGEIHVTLQAPPLSKEILIDISDTGKGMTKANANKIFNPVSVPKNVAGVWDLH